MLERHQAPAALLFCFGVSEFCRGALTQEPSPGGAPGSGKKLCYKNTVQPLLVLQFELCWRMRPAQMAAMPPPAVTTVPQRAEASQPCASCPCHLGVALEIILQECTTKFWFWAPGSSFVSPHGLTLAAPTATSSSGREGKTTHMGATCSQAPAHRDAHTGTVPEQECRLRLH